jgi:hypothetical protein
MQGYWFAGRVVEHIWTRLASPTACGRYSPQLRAPVSLPSRTTTTVDPRSLRCSGFGHIFFLIDKLKSHATLQWSVFRENPKVAKPAGSGKLRWVALSQDYIYFNGQVADRAWSSAACNARNVLNASSPIGYV